MTFLCSDPAEAELRQLWHQHKVLSDSDPTPDNVRTFHEVHRKLSDYLWQRVQTEVENDRKRHPKAKRNQPVQRNGVPSRHLP